MELRTPVADWFCCAKWFWLALEFPIFLLGSVFRHPDCCRIAVDDTDSNMQSKILQNCRALEDRHLIQLRSIPTRDGWFGSVAGDMMVWNGVMPCSYMTIGAKMTKAMLFLKFGTRCYASVSRRLQNLAQAKVTMGKLGLLKVCIKWVSTSLINTTICKG